MKSIIHFLSPANRMNRLFLLCVMTGVCLLTAAGSTLTAGDWPGFRGPNRNGVAYETGLLRKWGENGPPLLWKNSTVGNSMNGVAVVGNMTYTVGVKSGVECVFCIENRTGKTVWARPIGKAVAKTPYPMQRCTPTIYKNLVYVLSSAGNLVCLDSGSGFVRWTRNIVTSAGGVMPAGGYAESPYVDGKWVIVTPGGPSATIVAIDRHYGRNVMNGPSGLWVSKAGLPAGYASIIKASFGGEHQYVQFTGGGVMGVKVRGGDVRWKNEKTSHPSGMNINTPLWYGQTVLTSSAAGTGLTWVLKNGSTYSTEELWFKEDIKIPTGDMIKVNENVFACTDKDGLICFNYKEGNIIWKNKTLFPEDEKKTEKKTEKKPSSAATAMLDFPLHFPLNLPSTPAQLFMMEANCPPGVSPAAMAPRPANIPPAGKSKMAKKRGPLPAVPSKMASMTYADGLLYIRTSAGELALVEASPKGFKLRGKLSIPQMKHGFAPAPVIAGGLLYLREGGTIFCYDLRDASKGGKKEEGGEKKPLPGMPQAPKNVRQPPRVG